MKIHEIHDQHLIMDFMDFHDQMDLINCGSKIDQLWRMNCGPTSDHGFRFVVSHHHVDSLACGSRLHAGILHLLLLLFPSVVLEYLVMNHRRHQKGIISYFVRW